MDENPIFDKLNLITTDFDVYKREVIDDTELTLVAFLADWSGPCQILNHILAFQNGV
jgi:hypothetical protein